MIGVGHYSAASSGYACIAIAHMTEATRPRPVNPRRAAPRRSTDISAIGPRAGGGRASGRDALARQASGWAGMIVARPPARSLNVTPCGKRRQRQRRTLPGAMALLPRRGKLPAVSTESRR